MLKRIAIGIILLSMVLHCACSIGFLSYVYQQRHQIAYTLGMIDEVPIVVCSHEYETKLGQGIEISSESEQADMPISFHVQKIQLFFVGLPEVTVVSNNEIALSDNSSDVVTRIYLSPALAIFHPPC